MSMTDPYKVLGVDRSAPDDDVRRAYRKQAAKYHPDAGGDAWVFQQVQEAYELIQKWRGQPGTTRDTKHTPPASSNESNGDSNTFHQSRKSSAGSSEPESTKSQSTNSRKKSRSSDSENTSAKSKKSTRTGRESKRAGTKPKQETPSNRHWIRHLLTGELPLQNETTTFILIGTFDIFMTYMLLRNGAIEANPIANFFFLRWGFKGMVAFKMATIALVTVLAQVIAQFKMRTAKNLLIGGSILIGLVVIYSFGLLVKVLFG